MPRAFTDTERSAIRERLLAAGQDLFARRGIRATTVEQLARAAGISKGAFYLFYPSKEALFFAIVEEVETAMQARLEAAGRGRAARRAAALLLRARCRRATRTRCSTSRSPRRRSPSCARCRRRSRRRSCAATSR